MDVRGRDSPDAGPPPILVCSNSWHINHFRYHRQPASLNPAPRPSIPSATKLPQDFRSALLVAVTHLLRTPSDRRDARQGSAEIAGRLNAEGIPPAGAGRSSSATVANDDSPRPGAVEGVRQQGRPGRDEHRPTEPTRRPGQGASSCGEGSGSAG